MQCTIPILDTLSERRALLLIAPGLVERRFPDKCLQRTGKILAYAFEKGIEGGGGCILSSGNIRANLLPSLRNLWLTTSWFSRS